MKDKKKSSSSKALHSAAQDMVNILQAKYPQHSFTHDGKHVYLSYEAYTVNSKKDMVLVTNLFADEYGTLYVEPSLYYGIKEGDAQKFNAFNRVPFPCDVESHHTH